VNDASGSISLGAALYASRFACSMMRVLRRNAIRKGHSLERVPLLLKPSEPNFLTEDH
jgi:cyclic nucleotide gated channel, plant